MVNLGPVQSDVHEYGFEVVTQKAEAEGISPEKMVYIEKDET